MAAPDFLQDHSQERDWEVTPFCPTAALGEDRVRCVVARRFGRRRHADPAVEAAVEAAWAARVAANPRLFNGTKFRLHAFALLCDGADDGDCDDGGGDAPRLSLSLGLTDYRAYLGTNAAGAAATSRLRADAVARHGPYSDAYLSQKLGVGGVTVTADGWLIFIVRSAHVSEARGMVDVPGGHPEPARVPGLEAAVGDDLCNYDLCGGSGTGGHRTDVADSGAEASSGEGVEGDETSGEAGPALCAAAVRELFQSAADEVSDEANVPPEALGAPLLLGVVWQLPTAGTPSAAFALRCSLKRDEVEARYALGAPEAFESTRLLFLCGEELLAAAAAGVMSEAGGGVDGGAEDATSQEAVVAAGEARIAPLRFTPATRGCLVLWAEHERRGGLRAL